MSDNVVDPTTSTAADAAAGSSPRGEPSKASRRSSSGGTSAPDDRLPKLSKEQRRAGYRRVEEWLATVADADGEFKDRARAYTRALITRNVDLAALRYLDAEFLADLHDGEANPEDYALYSGERAAEEATEAESSFDEDATRRADSGDVEMAEEPIASSTRQPLVPSPLVVEEYVPTPISQLQPMPSTSQQPATSAHRQRSASVGRAPGSPPPSQLMPPPAAPQQSTDETAIIRCLVTVHEDIEDMLADAAAYVDDFNAGSRSLEQVRSLLKTAETKVAKSFAVLERNEAKLRRDFGNKSWRESKRAAASQHAELISTIETKFAQLPTPAAAAAPDASTSAVANMAAISIHARKATFKVRDIVVKPFEGGYREYVSFKRDWEAAAKEMELLGFTDVEKLRNLRACLKGNALKVANVTDSVADAYRKAWQRLDYAYEDDAQAARSLFNRMSRISRSLKRDDWMGKWEAAVQDSQDVDAIMVSKHCDMYELQYVSRFESTMPDGIFKEWRDWVQDQVMRADDDTARLLGCSVFDLPEDKVTKTTTYWNRNTILRFLRARRASGSAHSTASRPVPPTHTRGADDDASDDDDGTSTAQSASVGASFFAGGGGAAGAGQKRKRSGSRDWKALREKKRAQRASQSPAAAQTPPQQQQQYQPSNAPTAAGWSLGPKSDSGDVVDAQGQVRCGYCKKKGHHVVDCPKLLSKTPFEIKCWVQATRKCLGCFALYSPAHACLGVCPLCPAGSGRRHHAALHYQPDRIVVPAGYDPIAAMAADEDTSGRSSGSGRGGGGRGRGKGGKQQGAGRGAPAAK